ncbi:MAG: hypothetical protein MUD10_01820 [Candidatus Pacebacteria bacterium]|jgi:hypothetical protein|nr:hypothetical protein [Candidatus Paceibacterota bacterium]
MSNSRTLAAIVFFSALAVIWFYKPHPALGGSTINARAAISGCGNEKVEAGEKCDGANLDGTTCQMLGYAGGNLDCGVDCAFVVAGCARQASNLSGGYGGVSATRGTGITIKGDLNRDNQVDLVDFSIAVFWYEKKLTGKIAEAEKNYLNGNGKIDITDFSIMAYYWTK